MILTITGVDKSTKTCQCCGKANLQKTVILTERASVGATPTRHLRYGVVCARRATGFQGASVVKQGEFYAQATKSLRAMTSSKPDALPCYLGYEGR